MLRELWVLLRNFLRDFSLATLRGTKEHWKGLLIFCAIGIVATVALAAVALKATASPKFCGLCHNMKAYIDSWEQSSHKGVSCLECHFEPGVLGQLKGKWKAQAHVVMKLTGTAPPRPHTQISDASCLRQGCHAAADLTAADTTFLGVRFSHREHLGELRRGKRLRCVSCHSQIVQGQHLTVTESTCFLCHFYDRKESPELADCRTCHVQTRAKLFIDANESLPFVHQEYLDRGVACSQCHFNVISGDGHLKDNVCVQCHAEPKILLSRQTSESIHRDHVSLRKVDCLRCHAEIEHGIARETGPTDRQPVVVPAGFGADRYDANCVKCHSLGEHESIRRMYLGTGAEGLPDAPSPMYQAHADCGSCHVAQTETPAGPQETLRLRYPDVIQACADCHGAGYDDMAKHWKKLLTEETAKAESAVLEARQALGAVRSGAAPDAVRSLDVAERNLAFVRNGRGLHNVEYALGILGDARKRAEGTKARVLPRYIPKEVASPTGCVELCHSCVECIETAPVPFGGVQFPHDLHVQDEGMGCLECHTPRDQHGRTFLANCSSCHHGSGAGAVECQDCHEENHNLFNGQNACGEASCDVTGEKNPMAEAVSCGECHLQVVEGEKTTPEGIKAACLECHDDDPSYAALVDEWKAKADTLKVGELDAELQDLQRMVLRAIREGRYTYDAQDLVNNAEKNLKLLVKGNPVHNPVFAQDLAQRVTGLLKQARQTLRATSTVKTLPEEAYR